MRTLQCTLLLLVITVGHCFAGQKATLRFSKEGAFKIVQFTDTHINTDVKSNLASLEVISRVVALEKPDLVLLTGDIVTQENPAEGYRLLSEIFTNAGIPWAVVFGNHESERSFTRQQLAGLVEKIPGCLNEDAGGITGNSNFVLTVLGNNNKPGALLYCLDSNSYSPLKPKVDGYGWFDFSQIAWYRKKSGEYKHENGGVILPALAFFHIPLLEYTTAVKLKNQVIFGVRTEDESSAVINSGMFSAFLECGDVMGTFVGHDHLNDYITCYQGIALAYGRVSKIMKDPEDPVAGGRVILLRDGKRQFETWIREANGKKVLSCSYPSSFNP